MLNPIKKLFKSQEFYLELDEAEAGKTQTEAPAKKPEPAQVAAEPAEQPEPAQAAAEPAKPAEQPEPVKAAEPAKTKSKKSAKQPEPVKAAEPAKTKSKKSAKQPEPVKAAVASTNGKVEPQPGLTFAPNNLLPLPTSRRRPGPSMNKFREMARGVKTPK